MVYLELKLHGRNIPERVGLSPTLNIKLGILIGPRSPSVTLTIFPREHQSQRGPMLTSCSRITSMPLPRRLLQTETCPSLQPLVVQLPRPPVPLLVLRRQVRLQSSRRAVAVAAMLELSPVVLSVVLPQPSQSVSSPGICFDSGDGNVGTWRSSRTTIARRTTSRLSRSTRISTLLARHTSRRPATRRRQVQP